jgi:hypothetical protein
MGAKQSIPLWQQADGAVTGQQMHQRGESVASFACMCSRVLFSSCSGRTNVEAVPLPEAFLTALRAGVPDLTIQLPGTQEYKENNVSWNFDAIGSPSAILVPKTEEQIAAFLKVWSTAGPLPAPHSLSISGGRHSHYGLPDHGVVLDMSSFVATDIDVASKTGRFGSGMKLDAFDYACKKVGLATTAGTNPDTGIAGLTLGGGFGHLVRRHGCTVDNLLGVRVVLASGEVVVATRENEHKDLLWACSGGGGNFGVITEFTFQLHTRGDVFAGATVFLSRMFSDMRSNLQAWREFNLKASKNVACMMAMPCGGPIVFPSAYIGDDPKDGEKELAELRKIGSPLINSYSIQPYCRSTPADPIGKDLQSSAMEHQPAGNYYETAVVLREFSDGVIDSILSATSSLAPNQESQIVIAWLGGAVAEVDDDASAIGFRKAHAIVLVLGRWHNEKTKEKYLEKRTKVKAWCHEVVKSLAPWTLGSYNTLGDIALDGAKADAAVVGAAAADAGASPASPANPAAVAPASEAASSSSAVPVQTKMIKINMHLSEAQFKRIGLVKGRYDPTNLFRNNNNILPVQPSA